MNNVATPVRNVLFVDQGNICLSPMAEALLRYNLKNWGLEDVVVESAGVLENLIGKPPDPHAIHCMHERKMEIKTHRARTISSINLDCFQVIVCLDTPSSMIVRKRVKEPSKVIIKQVTNPVNGDLANCNRSADELEAFVAELAYLISQELGYAN